MKRFIAVFAASSLASAAFAQSPKAQGQEMKAQKMEQKAGNAAAAATSAPGNAADAVKAQTPDAMMGWVPRKVTKKDDKALDALYKVHEETRMKGDMAAHAATVDFPIYMVTDDAKGVVSSTMLTKEQYTKTMEPMAKAMANMPKEQMPKTKRRYEFITDSLAMAVVDHTISAGKEKVTTRGADLLINKDGKWLFKSSVYGGWGDAMKPATGGAGTAGSK
ncbi:MAG TPA: hypothetical protein VEY30_04040 [Myxococcaceae bacterium]|nr:hypothetical protein [Myxococcaceae bacterium]